MKNKTFRELGVSDHLVRQLKKQNIETPSAVQAEAIPAILNNEDVVVKAPTGSGKTFAFLLPLFELIKTKREAKPRVVILSPTRELSDQIHSGFGKLAAGTQLQSCLIIGGVRERSQVAKIKSGVDLVVATPGRLKDLIQQKKFDCSNVRHFILDEVDMMLDLGFYREILSIYQQMPKNVQISFFSATIPPKIQNLIKNFSKKFRFINPDTDVRIPDTITQKLYYTNNQEKLQLLLFLISKNLNKSIMVFSNKKTRANFIAYFLNESGIRAKSIHGDKPQHVRTKIINDFKNGVCNVLIGTDLAARGIHVDNVGLVINFDVPPNVDTYIHRMGRTGRANQKGECVTFSSFLEMDGTNSILKELQNKIEIVKFNAKDAKLPNNITSDILNSHPSYAIQARHKFNA